MFTTTRTFENNIENPQPKQARLKKKSKKDGSLIFIVTLLAIPVLYWLVFWLYVNIQTIFLAFMDARTGAFTFKNFSALWESLISPYGNSIGVSVKNTFIYFGQSLLISMPLCMVIAFFLYKRILGYRFFRIVFYLPVIISGVVMTVVYTQMIDPAGPLGMVMEMIGVEMPREGYLARAESATTMIVIYCIWTSFTSNVLLFGGGMARIPLEVLEAAKIDGCGPFREIINIVFPLIWPTVSTQIIFLFTGMFNSSGPILLFTNGQYETSTLNYWIFMQIYGDGTIGGTGQYNLVSCAGVCFTMVGIVIITIVRKIFDKVDSIEY
jgi:ABC-type sugar transport system permease subunit